MPASQEPLLQWPGCESWQLQPASSPAWLIRGLTFRMCRRIIVSSLHRITGAEALLGLQQQNFTAEWALEGCLRGAGGKRQVCGNANNGYASTT